MRSVISPADCLAEALGALSIALDCALAYGDFEEENLAQDLLDECDRVIHAVKAAQRATRRVEKKRVENPPDGE